MVSEWISGCKWLIFRAVGLFTPARNACQERREPAQERASPKKQRKGLRFRHLRIDSKWRLPSDTLQIQWRIRAFQLHRRGYRPHAERSSRQAGEQILPQPIGRQAYGHIRTLVEQSDDYRRFTKESCRIQQGRQMQGALQHRNGTCIPATLE